jgi:hypothetical protein
MDASSPSSDDECTEAVLGHISGVLMQRDALLRAVMSCEPTIPNTHTCSIEVIGAHVPDGLKAGAMTALFIIIAGLGWKDCLWGLVARRQVAL